MPDGRALETGAPTQWDMELIKRRLDQFAPLATPVPAVVLVGLPPAADVEGQLRVEGLESLLAAKRVALRPGTARGAAETRLAVVWLGDAPEELEALRRHPPRGRLLLWPRPEQAAETRTLLAGWSGPPPILCSPSGGETGTATGDIGADSVHVLPDPAHALWGLLDHHPQGGGVLELPDGGWDEILPPERVAVLRTFQHRSRALLSATGGLGPRLLRIARRRVLEAARRRVVAHATLSGTRVGGSVLAALLGRPFRVAPAAAPESAARIASYWDGWRAMVAAG